MNSISLRGITKRFGDVTALRDVSLDVEEGEYVVILGPTGAGKTTLLRIIAGLLAQDSGEVNLHGAPADALPPEEREVAYLSQTYSLFHHMTVWDNTTFGPTVKDWDVSRRDLLAREMLSMVRLMDRADAYPLELSGGMQQRCALARALSTGSRILLLDEPLRALDARLRLNLRRELRKLSTDLGITTLHVTHDQEEAITVADRILVLRRGTVRQIGPPEAIYESPAEPFVARFVGEANIFTGTVGGRRGTRTIMRTADGRELVCEDADLPEGEAACISILAELTAIEPGHVERENGIPGRVESVLFMGKWSALEVSLEDGSVVRVRVPSSRADRFDAGAEVTISFDPALANMYLLPPEGLEKALEVE
jgi:ABC-type Fe3+/spermidine/putrescine transport system ATPase subunit